jgi:hypothetical protein
VQVNAADLRREIRANGRRNEPGPPNEAAGRTKSKAKLTGVDSAVSERTQMNPLDTSPASKNLDHSSKMTARERSDLAMLIRQHERVLKSAAKERSAELEADFERQLGTIYRWDQDETWSKARALAQEMTYKASKAIAHRCAELGIPKQFAPNLSLQWYGRGENASKERRAELRRMAVTEIKALEAKAITQIERDSVEAQTKIVAAGLISDAAKAILDGMPSVQALMPPIDAHQTIKRLAGDADENDDHAEDDDDGAIGLLRSPGVLRSERNRRYYERKKLLAAPGSSDAPRLNQDGKRLDAKDEGDGT